MSEIKIKYTRHSKGVSFTHKYLFKCNKWIKELADENTLYSFISRSLLLHASLEGYANFLLECVDQEKYKNEKTFFASNGDYPGTFGKIKYLTETLDVPFDAGELPWQDIKKLQKIRNKLTHPRVFAYKDSGKAESLDDEFLTKEFYDNLPIIEIDRIEDSVVKVCEQLHNQCSVTSEECYNRMVLHGLRSPPFSLDLGFHEGGIDSAPILPEE